MLFLIYIRHLSSGVIKIPKQIKELNCLMLQFFALTMADRNLSFLLDNHAFCLTGI